MQVTYKTKKLYKICTDANTASKVYGEKMAFKIHLRIDQISAIDTVQAMIQYKIGRCHPLTNDRKGQYAVDLVHPYRLVFTVNESNQLQIVRIEEIVDYH